MSESDDAEVERWKAVWRDLLSHKTYRDALLVTKGLMETQHITAECRANRTVDGAWDEAVRRLREIYDAQVEHDPTIALGLTIGRVVNRPEQATPAATVPATQEPEAAVDAEVEAGDD